MRKRADMFIVDGKPLNTAKQVRKMLQDELALGHEVIPMGDCDNFDWKTGCKGHVLPMKASQR